MRFARYSHPLCLSASLAFAAVSALSTAQPQQTQTTPPITLTPTALTGLKSAGAPVADPAARLHSPAQTYREFSAARVGAASEPEVFTLNFHTTTKLTSFTTKGDFKVSGGTCIEGHTYSPGNVCSVDIAFTPKGPGHRTGKLSIAHSASAKPLLSLLGGSSYGPVVSFIPAQIQTVPATLTGTTGTLSTPQGLTVDGNDNLYIADTGNNLIKLIDSSGSIVTLVGGGTTSLTNGTSYGTDAKLTAPYGVTVDALSNVYFTDNGDSYVGKYFSDEATYNALGGGSTSGTSCRYNEQCVAYLVSILPPTSIAMDTSGNLYIAQTYGNGFPGFVTGEWTAPTSGEEAYFTLGGDAYNDYSSSNAITVDPFGYGNFYYAYLDSGSGLLSNTPLCFILGQNSSASDSNPPGAVYWTVAGSGQCGFSGDGGKAATARISNAIGAFAWDAAGNLYFTDTGNSRIRRIDAINGIIRTVAGNGSKGSTGDGGSATSASLNTPYALAVDSQGQVYTTNLINAGPTADIRVIGTVGQLTFPSTALSTPSAVQTILVSNTGNEGLNIAHIGLTSGNTGDFAIDPNTTTCVTTAPMTAGHSCVIGVIFTPSASGTRKAVITLADDTVNNSNLIQLTGTGASTGTPAKGTLSPTSLAFASQTVATTSAAKTITLSNSGTAALGITSLAFSGTNPADFAQTNTCGTSVAASASCTVSVTFTPAAAGSRSATLSVVTAAGTLTEAITGTGAAASNPAQATLTPATLTFASTAVGSSSATQVLTLANPGGSNLTISGYAFGGTNPTSFSQSHNCGNTLVPKGSCTYTVTFKPTAAGSLTATISVTTSAGVVSSTLNGTGTAAAVKPKVTLISKANPTAAHQAVILTTQVAGSSANQTPNQPAPVTAGKVQLREGTLVLATGDLTNGSATFKLLNLSTGTHTLTAWYLGDNHHPASESTPIQQVVGSGINRFLP